VDRSLAKVCMDSVRLGLRRTLGLHPTWVFQRQTDWPLLGPSVLVGLMIRYQRNLWPYAEAMLGLCEAAPAQEPVKSSALAPLPEPKGLFAYLEISEAFQLATQQLEVEQVMRRHVWRSA